VLGELMTAELTIIYGRDDDDIFNALFANDTQMFYTLTLNIDNTQVSSITESSTEAIYEILGIDDTTESFTVDRPRLLTILAKYNKHHRLIEFKKFLRVILRKNVETITIIRI